MKRLLILIILFLTQGLALAAAQIPTTQSSPKFIKRFNEKYLTVNVGLSGREQKAIEAYINDGYSEMNSCLRTKKTCTSAVQGQIAILKEHLSGFFVPAGTILYRGNGKNYPSFLKDLKVGETFSDAAFVSTSLDPKVAKKFTHAVFDIIEVPEGGVTGKRVRSKLYDEREVLLSPGLTFKIVKKESTGGVLIRVLKIVSKLKVDSFFNQTYKNARDFEIQDEELEGYFCYPYGGTYPSVVKTKNLGRKIQRSVDYQIRITEHGRLLLKPLDPKKSPSLCLQKIQRLTLTKTSHHCSQALEDDLLAQKKDFLRMCEANHYDHCASSKKIEFSRTDSKSGTRCTAKLVLWGKLDSR